MIELGETDIAAFGEAIFKDYGIRLGEKELVRGATNLLSFTSEIIKFYQVDNMKKGSKVVSDEPLNKEASKLKI